jgi:FAD/FMN-containing dehydrogenase
MSDVTIPAPTTPAQRAGNQTHVLEDLRRRVVGRLYTPADAEWNSARMAWVVNIPQHPMAVLEVHDADDVVAAVRWAVEHGCRVTAQPTGHAGISTLDQTVLLRTRALGGIDIDVQRRTATVGAGVKAGELCDALEGTGMTFLCGSNPDPSVTGMTITGGISWFGRAYGLGADSIVSIELVDGLGRCRRLSATEDPELFWAVRGGGGDFGVITRLEVALHPCAEVYGGRLLWPIEQMDAVLRTFREATESAPEQLTTWFHVYRFPPLPEIPEPIRGKAFAGVAVAFIGSRAEAEPHLAAYRAIPGMAMDLVGEVPLSALGAIADEPTDPIPGMQRSHLLDALDDDAIAALVATVGPDSGSPLTIVQIRHLGGAFAADREGRGSHGKVTEPYSVFALGVPAVRELVAPIELFFGRLSAAVAHVASGRTLLNFLEYDEDPGTWWSSETRERLAAAKQVSDPLGTIRSNRPVRA